MAKHAKAPFTLGTVGHLGLAVTDPRASADWYVDTLGLREEFAYEGGVAVGSDGVTLALFAGNPRPGRSITCRFICPTSRRCDRRSRSSRNAA